MRNVRVVFAIGALILGAAHALPWAGAAENDTAAASAATKDDWQPPRTDDGWLDLTALLVPSDGSRVPGSRRRDDPRDQGSKLVFFDPGKGDNAAGEVYWWDGKRIVDSSGSAVNEAGAAYGDNPLLPNEAAVKAFKFPTPDPRLQDSWGYPDWFLLRRGRRHETFEMAFNGGRSQAEPMVVAAYGPMSDGRAIVDPKERSPFGSHTGGDTHVQFHQVVAGLEIHATLSHLGMHAGCTSPGAPGVPTWYIEDCKMVSTQMNYLPIDTTLRRCVSAFNFRAKSHNQGYFNSGFDASPTFEEVIFYKNGYKTDPRSDPDPRRTIFDRNIYQGGGAQMGHTYRNIISADGGSGGPQMRLGGLIENSLIVEGYWFSSTGSNKPVNHWLTSSGQEGRSAVVRNNVQLIFNYPSPNDPDTHDASDNRAQPGNGYMLQGASFGAVVEGNIVSGALLTDDLGFAEHRHGSGFRFVCKRTQYQDDQYYTQRNNTVRGNIAYRTGKGLSLGGDWTDVKGNVVENNVFVAGTPVDTGRDLAALESSSQLNVQRNRFYSDESLPAAEWIGENNTLHPYADAAEAESWPDPDRTLKRYVLEVLGLALLDWSDDPLLDRDEAARRVAADEAYDPMGLKTFMAVATNMRRGGADDIPAAGKPSWTGDYPWDARFTGQAVVNWIREGFGVEKIPAPQASQ
ncbi:MAG: hypothetical protein ACOCWL_01275 [Thermoguttaceae bacterium]